MTTPHDTNPSNPSTAIYQQCKGATHPRSAAAGSPPPACACLRAAWRVGCPGWRRLRWGPAGGGMRVRGWVRRRRRRRRGWRGRRWCGQSSCSTSTYSSCVDSTSVGDGCRGGGLYVRYVCISRARMCSAQTAVITIITLSFV